MDSENCALFKEAAIEFFAANLTSVMPSSGWANVTESASIMKEIMEVVFIKKKRSAPAAPDEEKDYKHNACRLFVESSLDVDGSKDTPIRRLDEATKKRRRVMKEKDGSDNSGSSPHADNYTS
jgi:hypothetical protein